MWGNVGTREGMVKFINDCQRTVCAYDMYGFSNGFGLSEDERKESKPPSMCDCKFGADQIAGGSESGNGCPEFRCVRAILDTMTDKEFERIIKRMNAKAKKAWKEYHSAYDITQPEVKKK